jgi:hypothetical protein
MGIADDGKAKSEQDHEVVASTTGGSQGIGVGPTTRATCTRGPSGRVPAAHQCLWKAARYGSILLIVIGPAARARRIKTAPEESPSRRRS